MQLDLEKSSGAVGMTTPDVVQFLKESRDQIISRFVAAIQRKELSPPGVSRSLLIDHIPRFFDEVVAEVGRLRALRVSRDAVDTSETARRHGEQRWELGYDLEALIREYGVLTHCIIDSATDAGVQLSNNEFDALAECFSVGVAEAATEYIKYRDEQLHAERANLHCLEEAGQLLSSSLDYRSTLSRLTALVVPRLADCCTVYLEGVDVEDMPIAHVNPAKAVAMRELFRKFPLPPDSHYGYPAVLRTGEPQWMHDVPPEFWESVASSPEHLHLLRSLDLSSWMILPLRVQENVFGVIALISSDSKRRYTEQDLGLATELARRAAVAIDNARLYDLSQQERSRVEAATRAKDEFVAVVSHELRTPLNAILGWIRIMRSGALDESKRAHAFDVIERNAEAQGRLVADLLDISRVITGKIRIHPAQLNLCDVVDMAVEGVRPAADAKRLSIEMTVDRENAVLRGDADRLQQVVWNLLSNAVKFTLKSGRVRVQLRRIDSDVELVVEDDGAGIEPEFLPHVFESFRQSDVGLSRSHGGLGIGLSITKHIVELHGGTIFAESAGRGLGSKFTVRLPISPLVSTTMGITRAAATKRQATDVELPHGLEGLRVLVVDDEPDARDLLTYLLETCGIEVRAAASATEAMRELERYAPHLIISDIGMPDEDGYTLIRSVRTLPNEKRSIPAIALTAFARNEDRTRALVEGFNRHMAKPVEPKALVQAVVDLVGPNAGRFTPPKHS
jgi:signal transduction histidine kinase/CheY-like chemotaxis protein